MIVSGGVNPDVDGNVIFIPCQLFYELVLILLGSRFS